MQKKVLTVIDSLKLGGAENTVANTIVDLRGFDHTLVLLSEENDFKSKNLSPYCINHHRKYHLFRSVLRLRNIIKKNGIEVIHAHLFWSTIIARIACVGLNVKFYFTLHTIMSKDSFDKSELMTAMEKLTYKKTQTVIAVSKTVLNDYDKKIGIKGSSHVLHNFVEDIFFRNTPLPYTAHNALKLVAVGNLKPVKNYNLLTETFKLIDNTKISLDIYGDGPEMSRLTYLIQKENLNIHLKGKSDKLHLILPNYHVFVMPSHFEGFGIAPLEAMASGLPVLLSENDTFKEIAEDTAIFFDSNKPQQLASILEKVVNGEVNLKKMSSAGKKKAQKLSEKTKYLKLLHNILLPKNYA